MLAPLLVAPPNVVATKAQVLAALPPELRTPDLPNPKGEARYRRLVDLGRQISKLKGQNAFMPAADRVARAAFVARSRPLLRQIGPMLDGPIRFPASGNAALDFPRTAELKLLAKALALEVRDDAERHDRLACVRDAEVGLKLGRVLVASEGQTINLLVSLAVAAIGERAVYDAEMQGAFTNADRRRLLAQLPPPRRTQPALAAALRREFRVSILPKLLDPAKARGFGTETDASTGSARSKSSGGAASFDALATARLAGRLVPEAVADTERPIVDWRGVADHLARELSFDDKRTDEAHLRSVPNVMGRLLLSSLPVTKDFAEEAAMSTARTNLLRAVLLVHMGETAAVPDPFSRSDLQVDPKRRLVWSVGRDGKDDGGQIGTRIGANSPDIGYRY